MPAIDECGTYKCNPANFMCRNSCTVDGDCFGSNVCNAGVCGAPPPPPPPEDPDAGQ
jgi:hypothetical protein